MLFFVLLVLDGRVRIVDPWGCNGDPLGVGHSKEDGLGAVILYLLCITDRFTCKRHAFEG